MGAEAVGLVSEPTYGHGAPANTTVFIACAIPGLAVMAYGIYGLFHAAGQTQPSQWLRWFIGGLLVHDFVIAPLVFLIAVGLVRRVSSPWKASLQGASIASGILILSVWPYVAGYGRKPDNPTLLPNNYALGLLVVLAVVWMLAAATGWWTARARKSESLRDEARIGEVATKTKRAR